MKIVAWRIVKTQHKNSAFDGEGARIAGGRWNRTGIPMIYTADSLALAALETIVHLPKSELLERIFFHIPVQFDAKFVMSLSPTDLPDDWDRFPTPDSTQAIGTEWALEKESVVLKVPSTVIREEFNYLINPAHCNFQRLTIGNPEKFVFDPRITDR